MEEAEEVFQDMLLAKVRPSTVVFNNLISGLSRSGHAHRAFKYFNDVGYTALPHFIWIALADSKIQERRKCLY